MHSEVKAHVDHLAVQEPEKPLTIIWQPDDGGCGCWLTVVAGGRSGLALGLTGSTEVGSLVKEGESRRGGMCFVGMCTPGGVFSGRGAYSQEMVPGDVIRVFFDMRPMLTHQPGEASFRRNTCPDDAD